MAGKKITLDCGVSAERWSTKTYESLHIDMIDLYRGYGMYNDPALLSKLFKELADKGFHLSGLMTETGYYDSIDGMKLHAMKTFPKDAKSKK